MATKKTDASTTSPTPKASTPKAGGKAAAPAAPKSPATKTASAPAKKAAAKAPAVKGKAKAPALKKATSHEAMLARVESVRLAQRSEGHFDCFGRAAQGYCDQGDCAFHAECMSVSRLLHSL